MLKPAKQPHIRLTALFLCVTMFLSTLFFNAHTAYAADGTIDYKAGAKIPYGDYYTSRMSFDGNNTAYCVEPLKKTPASGKYPYNLLGKNSPLRKALYYLNGGYGYEKVIKDQYFQGWSDDNSYVIGHLVVSYIHAGNNGDAGAFHGAPQNYIDKALEVANAIEGLPAPPESFRAFIVPGNASQTFAGSWYQVPNGFIELQKSSANTDISDKNGNYSLEGAKYGIYKGEELVETLVTDKKGYAKSKELAEGSYTVKEISAPEGFAIDPSAHNVTVKAEGTSTVKVKDIPQNNPVKLLLKKLDADTQQNSAQGTGSLANAEFTIKFYTEQSATDPGANGKKPVRTWILKTDASGEIHFTKDYLVSGDEFFYASDGKTVCFPLGTVTVQETKAPAGYLPNESVFVQQITSTGTEETISIYNASSVEEQVFRGGVKIQKRDLETQGTQAQGTASLADAEFTITTLNKQPVWVGGKLYENGQAVLTIKSDAHGIAASAADALPLGHYRIEETKAPSGYLTDGAKALEFDITQNGEIVDLTTEETSVSNQIIRGGVKIQKRDLETGEAKPQGNASLKDAEFTITNLGPNPVLVDGTLYEKDQVVLTLKTDEKGLASTKKDTLPYGHYRGDETKAPEGYLNEGKLSQEFHITENGKILDLTAKETAISNQVIRGDLEFVKVSDGDLNRLANVPFSITSKTTGESHTIVTDKNGYASTSSEWNKHTTNTNRGETSEDGIWFGSSKPDDTKGALIYDTYILEEQRCDSNEGMNLLKIEVSVYKNHVVVDMGTLTDDQITIGTTALDKDSNSHFAKPEEKITLVDTVEYEGLKKGQSYKLIGTLMDQESGKPIEIDGKPVTAETTFKPKKSSGSAKVTFTFNASSLKGKTIVVFEELYQEDLKLAVHADITDQDQTIYFPEIGTTAKDKETDMNLSQADKEVTLVDTVAYKNLLPGEEYVMTGTLMDKETGKPVEIDKKEVTAETTFTPKESSGTVDVIFSFDGTSLAGKTVVVFESATYDGKEFATHADLEDNGQTIYFPEIATTAKDKADGDHFAKTDKEITIVDTVKYSNLIPRKEYALTGTLMDKETKEPLQADGKPFTATTTFTPEDASGSIELTFTFDGSILSGKTIVVFESLTYQEKEIAVHADIEDHEQSIYFPGIGTTAKDKADGDQEAVATKEVTIIDTVSYQNLIPDTPYKLVGTLMDKTTQKEVMIDGKPVTAETEFTPKDSNGSVEVIFTFDGSTLAGHDVVVFEKLFSLEGETALEIASHEDLDDKGQTIKLTEAPKDTPEPSKPVKTGDETTVLPYLLLAGAALLFAAGFGILYIRKRKKDK